MIDGAKRFSLVQQFWVVFVPIEKLEVVEKNYRYLVQHGKHKL